MSTLTPASGQGSDPNSPQSSQDAPPTASAGPGVAKVLDELTFNTAPNILTTIRVAFVPVVVAMLFARTPFWDVMAGVAFTVASITDFFDGYLARRQKLETVYGKLMDPLADKFLVVSSLIMLQELGRIHPVVVILLICREMAITSLRALASAEGLAVSGASTSAKWKTGTQMVAIPWIMARELFGIPLYTAGMILLYISLAISLWSAKDYVVDFFRAIKRRREARLQMKRSAREAKLAAKAAKKAARLARRGQQQV